MNPLSISYYLPVHPILDEPIAVRRNYMNALSYFYFKYGRNKQENAALYEFYIKTLMQDKICEYTYTEEHYRNEIYGSCSNKYSWSNLYRGKRKPLFVPYRKILLEYRYVFVLDCCLINYWRNPKQAENMLRDILHNTFPQSKIDALYKFAKSIWVQNHDGWNRAKLANVGKIWNENLKHNAQKTRNILVTATMSAGKSTLINALIGKKINRTQSEACTAKLHEIYSKPIEDGFIAEYDAQLSLDASYAELMEDHVQNNTDKIEVGVYFDTAIPVKKPICITDTPGVNSSLHNEHRVVTEKALMENEFDAIVIVIGSDTSGTNDVTKHIEFVLKNGKAKQLIFVLNKIDQYKHGEDSVSESVNALRKQLIDMGLVDPIICPVSARAGYLAKKAIRNEALDWDEEEELELWKRKFERPALDISPFFPRTDEEQSHFADQSRNHALLMKCGVLQLEKILFQS